MLAGSKRRRKELEADEVEGESQQAAPPTKYLRCEFVLTPVLAHWQSCTCSSAVLHYCCTARQEATAMLLSSTVSCKAKYTANALPA